MIKLQPFKIAMPASSRATPWAAAVVLFDCVGRRQALFNGALGTEENIARQMRNWAFRVANRTPLITAKEAEMLRGLEERMMEAREQDRIFEREMLYSPARRCGKSATATEMLSQHEPMLFVGGPADGKCFRVPVGMPYFRVAERKPIQFAPLEMGGSPVFEESFKTYLYERRGSKAFKTEVMAFVE